MSAKIEPVLRYDRDAIQRAFAVNGGVLVVTPPGDLAAAAATVDPAAVVLDLAQGEASLPWSRWRPGSGVGDWDDLAPGLSGATVVVLAPRALTAHPETRRGLRGVGDYLTALGATVMMLHASPGALATGAKSLNAREWLAALSGDDRAVPLTAVIDPGRTGTGAASEGGRPARAEGADFLDVDASDRIELTDAVVDAVLAANERSTTLFLSGHSLVTVYGGELMAVDSKAALADWCKTHGVPLGRWKRKIVEGETKPWDGQFLPDDVAGVLVTSPLSWRGRLPELASLSVLPFMRPDGSFVERAGYDRVTRVFITDEGVGAAVARVPERVSQELAAKSARWLLDNVFRDFPFVTQADRANTLGLMLTALTRYVHVRPSPLFGIVAPDAGTGKGLLTDVVATILQGKAAEPSVLSDSEDEQRKAITTVLRSSSDPVVSWDNLQSNSKVSSRILCQLHTSATWKDRLLGGNTELRLENDRLWIATGNNIGPGEDMVRRWVQISLDAGTPHPEERTGFLHKDLRSWILAHREDALCALLGMLRGWHQAGRPKPREDLPILGDYRPIVKVVGGVLEFAGVPGFLGNTASVREDAAAGSEEENAEEFLHWLASALPWAGADPTAFHSGHVVDAIETVGGASAMLGIAGSKAPIPTSIASKLGKGAVSGRNAVSYYLASIRDRRFGDWGLRVVKRAGKLDRLATFDLVSNLPGPPPQHPQVTDWVARHPPAPRAPSSSSAASG